MKILRVIFIGFSSLLFLGAIFFYQQAKFNDGRLRVIFCNVGQGDAIFIRTPDNKDILVDGGPNDSVLKCLSNHMPFWDKDLELVILTHPHNDHLNGLIKVFNHYKVLSFATEDLQNDTAGFNSLIAKIKGSNLRIQYLYAGNTLGFADGVNLKIVGPSKEFLRKTSPGGFIGERSEFASLETLVNYKDFSILLTGDSQASELIDAISNGRLNRQDMLQVPHHGSKTGLTPEILDYIKPMFAVISVGKNNKYGHPAKEIIKMLRDKDIKTLRIDKHGEVEIATDGLSWAVK